jgi:hypothetical protein
LRCGPVLPKRHCDADRVSARHIQPGDRRWTSGWMPSLPGWLLLCSGHVLNGA